MDIREALEKLSGFIDMVAESGFLYDDELENIQAVESMICAYVREKGDM